MQQESSQKGRRFREEYSRDPDVNQGWDEVRPCRRGRCSQVRKRGAQLQTGFWIRLWGLDVEEKKKKKKRQAKLMLALTTYASVTSDAHPFTHPIIAL